MTRCRGPCFFALQIPPFDFSQRRSRQTRRFCRVLWRSPQMEPLPLFQTAAEHARSLAAASFPREYPLLPLSLSLYFYIFIYLPSASLYLRDSERSVKVIPATLHCSSNRLHYLFVVSRSQVRPRSTTGVSQIAVHIRPGRHPLSRAVFINARTRLRRDSAVYTYTCNRLLIQR